MFYGAHWTELFVLAIEISSGYTEWSTLIATNAAIGLFYYSSQADDNQFKPVWKAQKCPDDETKEMSTSYLTYTIPLS